MVWDESDYQIIGPSPSLGNKEVFECALKEDCLTAAMAARKLNLKIANASMKLKQLEKDGFLIRSEETSPSGGKEFYYYRVK